jgi:YesN/AraC family two-component response regulator
MYDILMIDDEKVICETLALLSKGAFVVDYASNGKDGLRLFKEKKYDLIITDFNMSGLTGLDVIDSIRKRDNKTPIILLTGNISIEEGKDFMLIRKTVPASQLIEKILSTLKGA